MKTGVREVTLRPKGATDSVRRGHPWIWRDAVARGLDGVGVGEDVRVVSSGPDAAVLGCGIADPASPIAVRMWTRHRSPLDADGWRARVEGAAKVRERLVAREGTNAFRVLHGEGDRTPGFVVDRYDRVAVLRTDGPAATARAADLAAAIAATLASWSVPTLVHRTGAKGEAPRFDVLAGPPPPDTITVRENGLSFVVDLARGQKTGAFLDQRDNRQRVRELASGARVLNLFSYAGGFSLYAAAGGARHVTSVDVAANAHATAQASFRASGLDPAAHAFKTADAFAFLEAARQRGERWDVVISDPPSFAPNEKSVGRAMAAYRSLHKACAAVLAPGGLFCAASCSSHVGEDAFLSTLDDAALDRDDLRVLEIRGAGADHPVLPAFPEGHYLKFVVMG
jgi:23S rRNA (cytosine1962-C5)-methyltransferase